MRNTSYDTPIALFIFYYSLMTYFCRVGCPYEKYTFVLIGNAHNRHYIAEWSIHNIATYIVWLIGNFSYQNTIYCYCTKATSSKFHAPPIVCKLPQIQFITYTCLSLAGFYYIWSKYLDEVISGMKLSELHKNKNFPGYM